MSAPLRPDGGALSGIVIADFSRVLAGPYCTMLLADMGATVIKVEAPAGDETRTWRPPEVDGQSTYFMSINRNKRSVVLDLKDEKDRETAFDIIDRADVFIENFKPGGLRRFGLDAEAVAERWPHLVHASITGFGTDGGAEMPGYDLLVQAMSGMMTLTGEADGEPQRSGVAIFDVVTGLHAAVAIQAALHVRDSTGLGQHVEVNLFSSALSGLVNQTGGYAAAGNVPSRMGNDHPSLFPYGPFRAADRAIVICCGNDRQFSRLMTSLGAPELAQDPRFRTMSDRNQHREQLRPLIEDALGAGNADDWFTRLQADGIPCAPILRVDEGVEFAERLGLEPVVELEDADTGHTARTIRNPITFSRTPVSYATAPPRLGSDQESVHDWIRTTSPHPHLKNS